VCYSSLFGSTGFDAKKGTRYTLLSQVSDDLMSGITPVLKLKSYTNLKWY